MNAPIFIVGANRSGTTLLRLMLNAHPRIGIPEELIYFSRYIAGVSIENWRAPGLRRDAYATFVDRFLEGNCAPLDRLDRDRLRGEILEDGPHDLRRPYQLALEHWARRHGKERWGEKTPGNLFYVEVILDMFPGAQFIHLVRDPRAGVRSMNGAPFFSGDAVINALNRRKYVQHGLALQERMPADRWTLIRYEDLVAAPEQTLRTLCDFLGEPYEPAMLHFHEDAGRYMKDRAANGFNRSATRPLDESKIDAWRNRLAPREVAIAEHLCADQMQRLGYTPEGRPLDLRARLELLIKTAYYHLQCRRHSDVPEYLLVEPIFTRSRRRLKRLFEHAPV